MLPPLKFVTVCADYWPEGKIPSLRHPPQAGFEYDAPSETAAIADRNTDERAMSKLSADIRKMIDGLCQKGDQFAQIDQHDDALDQYEAAWRLLPDPKDQWPAATWILMAAGDVYFEKRDFTAASDTLREALELPDGDSNAFIWLRLGQSLFELGRLDEAGNALEMAFRAQGEPLFADEDPKYLQFLRTQLGIAQNRSTVSSRRFNKPL